MAHRALFIAIQVLADSLYYGRLTCTAWTFLQVNLLQGLAQNYGTHPWHWYLGVGALAPLFSYYPMVLVGSWTAQKSEAGRWVLALVCSCVAVLSLSPHKEYRFLLPVMPMLVLLAAFGLEQFSPHRARIVLVGCVLLQVPVALYTAQIHQSASLATVDFLRDAGAESVDFWLDCHLTPFYSHFHRPLALYFLDCSPFAHPTEVQRFFASPALEGRERLVKLQPEFLVVWSPLWPEVEAELRNYTEVKRFFHAHFTESPRGDAWDVSFIVLRKVVL